jgi:hypothetical protein
MTDLARRVAAHRGIDHVADPLSPDVGVPKITASEENRSAKWETILVVGDPAVIEAGQRWKQSVWRLEWFARGRLRGQSEWDRSLRQAGDAKHAFYQVVRKSLGSPGGALRRFELTPWIAYERARALQSASRRTDEVTCDEARVEWPEAK